MNIIPEQNFKKLYCIKEMPIKFCELKRRSKRKIRGKNRPKRQLPMEHWVSESNRTHQAAELLEGNSGNRGTLVQFHRTFLCQYNFSL